MEEPGFLSRRLLVKRKGEGKRCKRDSKVLRGESVEWFIERKGAPHKPAVLFEITPKEFNSVGGGWGRRFREKWERREAGEELRGPCNGVLQRLSQVKNFQRKVHLGSPNSGKRTV